MKMNWIEGIFGYGLLLLWGVWFFVRPRVVLNEQIRERQRVPEAYGPDKPKDVSHVFYFVQGIVYLIVSVVLARSFNRGSLMLRIGTVFCALLGGWMLYHGVLFMKLIKQTGATTNKCRIFGAGAPKS